MFLGPCMKRHMNSIRRKGGRLQTRGAYHDILSGKRPAPLTAVRLFVRVEMQCRKIHHVYGFLVNDRYASVSQYSITVVLRCLGYYGMLGLVFKTFFGTGKEEL